MGLPSRQRSKINGQQRKRFKPALNEALSVATSPDQFSPNAQLQRPVVLSAPPANSLANTLNRAKVSSNHNGLSRPHGDYQDYIKKPNAAVRNYYTADSAQTFISSAPSSTMGNILIIA